LKKKSYNGDLETRDGKLGFFEKKIGWEGARVERTEREEKRKKKKQYETKGMSDRGHMS